MHSPESPSPKLAVMAMLAMLLTACGGGESHDVARNDSAGSSAAGAANGPEAYEAVTPEGRIRLEILGESQARLTMRPHAPGTDGMPEQMSFDVPYERVGEAMVVALPGDDPMQLMRDGHDFVATMNGETARFVRQ